MTVQNRETPVRIDPNRRSILFRITRLALVVTTLTVGLFMLLILPYQRRELIQRLESTAEVMATSLEQVTVTSVVLEDYSTAIDHSLKVVRERDAVLYLVITRADGFSLIHTADHWRYETLGEMWTPASGESSSRFVQTNLVEEQVFHFTYPINYSGIDWGWIHIGLSLQTYDEALQSVYVQTVLLAFLCILVGSFLSFLVARRMSGPILQLNDITRQVASGDLTVKAEITTQDEIESLANSFNQMTDSLRLARDELEIRVQERTSELSESNGLLKQEIAERKKAEELREKLESDLRQMQKMEAVGQLTAGISHNFNNMLGIIIGNLELAEGQATGTVEQYIKRAANTSVAASDMIKDLMLFSRKAPIQIKPLSLFPVAREAVEICLRTFDRKIEIDLEDFENLPLISGDSTQIQQIFLNLCINARDALESGNRPRISPRITVQGILNQLTDEDCQSRPGTTPGEYVRVTISDNGPGMDESTQQHIFEPFFTTKELGKGTGLGLTTVYGIVQQHTGWIEVDSRLGEGAEFHFFLPLASQQVSPANLPSPGSQTGGIETILIVEDEEEIRNILTTLFSRNGYSVLVGEDGKEGLDVYQRKQEQIDLVLLDLSMPKMSGQEVLAGIRAMDTQTDVIILTGHTANAGEFPGVRQVIKKPFRGQELLGAIRNVLDSPLS